MTEEQMWYTPPKLRIFNEMKRCATKIRKGYSDEYGYVTGKLAIVNALRNESSNFMLMLQMFHPIKQRELIAMLSPEARDCLKERLGKDYYILYSF